jgi:hypothetical protein
MEELIMNANLHINTPQLKDDDKLEMIKYFTSKVNVSCKERFKTLIVTGSFL